MIDMAQHFVSVCIFCFLCATHSPCASHAEIVTGSGHRYDDSKPFKDPNDWPTIPGEEGSQAKRDIIERTATNDSSDEYLGLLFKKYGDGNSISLDAFKQMMQHLDLVRSFKSNDSRDEAAIKQGSSNESSLATKCVDRDKLYDSLKNNMNNADRIDNYTFKEACPVILYNLIIGNCHHDTSVHNHINDTDEEQSNSNLSWLYSMIAVLLISACGILGLGVIPLMKKTFYEPLLQFLIALAVGTLAGDALLHLLPHSMMDHIEEDHHGHHDPKADASHMNKIHKGVVAMLAMIFFFLMERILMLADKWRKKQQLKDKLPSRLKVIKPEVSTQLTNASEKQCKHKYSSFPYCYDEINADVDGGLAAGGEEAALPMVQEVNSKLETPNQNNGNSNETNKSNNFEINNMFSNDLVGVTSKDDTDSIEYTVILREHENRHHGHSHTHGHVHAAPKTMSSVAWMVIMGDGLHNFTDGMAIGAAFASSYTGGFSTAVAVFCHELPHELGDFAMLLKAGMSMKQALLYNLLSSVLCLFGNMFGLWLGNTEHASSWIFAIAAGMFLYIALVDMIPELISGHEGEGTFTQSVLHLGGLLLGFGIMALIAVYEHDLKRIFEL